MIAPDTSHKVSWVIATRRVIYRYIRDMTGREIFQISPVTDFYAVCHTVAWKCLFRKRTGEKILKIRTVFVHFFAYICPAESTNYE
jgi:hypothetical protein